MSTLYINLSKINFGVTLGVWHFGKRLLHALKNDSEYKFVGILPTEVSIPENITNLFDSLTYANKVTDISHGVELLLHHFQSPLTKCPYVIIFYDLHIFDVSWKYGNPELQKLQLEKLISDSTAILTPFPRTYFDLPKAFNKVPNALFLTTSPCMKEFVDLPVSRVSLVSAKYGLKENELIVLYPAQFQPHKNHITLFKAIKEVKNIYPNLSLICCGSEFREEFSRFLVDAISELQGDDFIRMVGYVEDIELDVLYEKSALIVSTSLAEGGAYLAQEAILKGKNIVMSDIRSVRMHLKLMSADIPLFNPLNITQIAKVISMNILNQQDNSNAKSKILSWSWEDLSKEYWAVLRWVFQGCKLAKMPGMSVETIGFALSGDIL